MLLRYFLGRVEIKCTVPKNYPQFLQFSTIDFWIPRLTENHVIAKMDIDEVWDWDIITQNVTQTGSSVMNVLKENQVPAKNNRPYPNQWSYLRVKTTYTRSGYHNGMGRLLNLIYFCNTVLKHSMLDIPRLNANQMTSLVR